MQALSVLPRSGSLQTQVRSAQRLEEVVLASAAPASVATTSVVVALTFLAPAFGPQVSIGPVVFAMVHMG